MIRNQRPPSLRCPIALASLLGLLHFATTPPVAADPSIEVAGILITHATYVSEPDGEKGEFQRTESPFSKNRGTRLAFILKTEDESILDIDSKGALIDTWGDNAGQDFHPVEKEGSSSSSRDMNFGINYSHRISDDKQVGFVYLDAPQIPGAEASHLVARGRLPVLVGSSLKTIQLPHGPIETGKGYSLGESELTIMNLTPSSGGDSLELSFKTDAHRDQFEEIRLLDKDGKEIKSRISSSATQQGVAGCIIELVVEGAVKEASLELSFWDSVETVEVPFDFKVGVGAP